MSYEGRIQVICENGHLDCVPEPYRWGDEGRLTCNRCKGEIAWENSVDDTNCDAYGFIPQIEFDKVLISAAVVETCNLGHQHITQEAVYRVPQKGELARFYHHPNGDWLEIPR